MKALKKEFAKEIRELCVKKVEYDEPVLGVYKYEIYKLHESLMAEFSSFWAKQEEYDETLFYSQINLYSKALETYYMVLYKNIYDIYPKINSILDDLNNDELSKIDYENQQTIKRYVSLLTNVESCRRF